MTALDRTARIRLLMEKGVRIPLPDTVDIDADVQLDRISGNGVVLGPGSRLSGKATLILDGARIGEEGPATVIDCHVGPGVVLGSGYFNASVFLEGAKAGSGAHLRPVCILEEHASIAHTVGMKQTILFPFVTLGSLINFCDCLMTGGTDKDNHSEVGSSFIHFNFTPNQDKATPSIMGNVPQGVMLNQPPIFLGGQGGVVGPCRIAFGTVTAAGSICRKDVVRHGQLVMEGNHRRLSMPFTAGVYRQLRRPIRHNIDYLANLIALRHWYFWVRARFMTQDGALQLWSGLMDRLSQAEDERIRRLAGLRDRMPASLERLEKESGAPSDGPSTLMAQHHQFYDRWPAVREVLGRSANDMGDHRSRDALLASLESAAGSGKTDYLSAIRALKPEAAANGTAWLESIVAEVLTAALAPLPLFRSRQNP